MESPLKIFGASKNSFKGEEEGEEVILLLRSHPIIIIFRLLSSIFFLLVPIILGFVFLNFIDTHHLYPTYIFLCALWYLLVWQMIFYALTMYTLDVWIVTNHRIIDSAQHGFFNRTVSELHLSRIQDISVITTGFIPTIFHFGNLQIQTAGTEEKFMFLRIQNPEQVKDEIMKVLSPHIPTSDEVATS